MDLKTSILALSALVFLNSCTSEKQSESKLTPVSVRQEWFPNANFAGEVVAMYETDSIHGLDLTVEAGSDNIDPIKLVLAGQNDFGVVGADKVLMANEKGADLVVIGVLNYKSPTVFLTKKNSNILTPNDFINKKVGILTGTATEYIYRSMIGKSNVDTSKSTIQEVEAPFDLTTFIAGQYDVRPAFIYDEPVSLDIQKIEYNVIRPEDYGVKFLGTVYFTTKKMVAEHPEIVRNFIKVVSEGWALSIQNPEKAIDYLLRYDNTLDKGRELKSLVKAIPYFEGFNSQLLYCPQENWDEMAKTMIGLKLLQKNNSKTVVNNTFINELR
jgi:NitT/TauT family transport system substrate-binding protein